MYAIRSYYDQDVARHDVRADPDDAPLIEVHQRLFRHVGDLARDLLLAPLGVPHVQLELLNVDRAVRIRITSYNVCYTKLLRSSTVSCAPAGMT